MIIRRASALFTLGLTLALGACSSPEKSETIKIALAGPVTGDVSQYGDMQMTGGQMAIQRINAAGGVNGKQLEAVIYDDACDPKQAVAVANKIVNDGIQFVLGHLCSSSTQPASDIYEDAQVLMITAASTSPEITTRGLKMVFRTIGLDSHQGPTAGNFIADKIKPQKIAIIHDKQQYGEGIATAVKQTLEKRGYTIGMFEAISKGDKDFSALISRLQQEGIDFVYYGGYHPELGLMLRQSAEKGFTARFMGPEGVGNADISAIAGAGSEGLLVTLPPSFDKIPSNQALAEEFNAQGKDPSGAFVLTSYAAVQIMADAMKATAGTDTQKIQAHIRQNSFNTPIGTLNFDEKGDLKAFDFVVYNWHANGTKTEAR